MNLRQTIEILMKVLADRSLIMLTLLLNFALFAFSVYQPSELRVGLACAFSILVFIPILRHERRNSDARKDTVYEERDAA